MVTFCLNSKGRIDDNRTTGIPSSNVKTSRKNLGRDSGLGREETDQKVTFEIKTGTRKEEKGNRHRF